MRASLPEALDKINAELALSYAQAGKVELARLHIQFMRETNQGLDNVEKTAELVLAPVKARLWEQIKRAEDKLRSAPSTGPQIAKQLLDEAEKCARLFDLFFTNDHEGRNDLFDEVAKVCNLLVVAYHKTTKDDTTCLAILRATLPLTTAIDLRELLEKNIQVFGGNIRLKEVDGVYVMLKSIQDADDSAQSKLNRFEKEATPAIMEAAGIVGGLGTFVLLGGHTARDSEMFNSASVVLREISVEAWNNGRDTKTALRALELALQYARDTELRKRLENDQQTLQRLIEQAAQEEALRLAAQRREEEKQRNQKIAWAVGVGVVVILIIIGNLSSSDSTSPSTAPRTTPPPQSSSYTPPSGYNYTPPAPVNRNTYRVPSYLSSELSRDRQAVEAQKVLLDNLSREIDSERLLLDRTSQWAVDQFNLKVNKYEEMRRIYNQMVDNYNEKLRRYGR